MRIERQVRRSNQWQLFGCGCVGLIGGMVIVLVIGLLIMLPALPGLALRLTGFTPKGNTEQVFNQPVPAPSVEVQNPSTPPEAVINLGQYGSQPIDTNTNVVDVEVGSDNGGSPLATVTFTEQGLMDLCYQRDDVCGSSSGQYRNPRIDLRPGGAVIYADFYVPDLSIWQPAGVVLRLNAGGQQFEVAGVDMGGTLYAIPPGEMGNRVAEVAQTGNAILNQLTLDASGGNYTLTNVAIDDNTLTLIMH